MERRSLVALSKLAFPVIVALVARFAVVIKLRLDMHGWPPLKALLDWDALYVPQTFGGFSTFFVIAAFSCGATIIIAEIQESMKNTDEFIGAVKTSLWIIWGSYSVLGGTALLIYQQIGPVPNNTMARLPSGSAAQEPLLLFITMVTLFTYPLAMQPVASIFEQALIKAGFGADSSVGQSESSAAYGALTQVETDTATEKENPVALALRRQPCSSAPMEFQFVCRRTCVNDLSAV